LKRSGDVIKCSPIKGTSKIAEFGDKDKAENIMIVDLMRNDFGQICESGSIDVPRLLATEIHPGLFHLVSDVVGKLKSGISWRTILSSLTPIGSISGAPKSSALATIKNLERCSARTVLWCNWVVARRSSGYVCGYSNILVQSRWKNSFWNWRWNYLAK
jgi:para-aminobenzoate synthetase component 1